MTKENNKNWIIAILIFLVVLFLFLYLNTLANYNLLDDYTVQCENTYLESENYATQCEDAYEELENLRIDLHNRWVTAFSSLQNCYRNNVPSCTVTTPYLEYE